MPPPVKKFNLGERTWGQLPLAQVPSWAAILNAGTYGGDGFDNSAGSSPLHDVEDPTLDQDAATKFYVDALSGARDLLTGDSSTFAAGIGDWVTTGGATVTDDTTFAEAWLSGTYHNLKIEPGGFLGNGATCPIDGVFRQGVRYAALFVIKTTDGCEVALGSVGGSDLTTLAIPVTDEYMAHVVYWTPSADRSDVVVYAVGSGGAPTEVIRVDRCVVVRADVLEETLPALTRIPGGATDDGGPALILLNGTKLVQGTGAFLRFVSQNVIHMATDNDLTRIEADGDLGQLNLWAFGGAASDLSDEGIDIEVGPDGVGLRLSEKDSATLQMYSDADGIDIELATRTGGGTWIIDGGGP